MNLQLVSFELAKELLEVGCSLTTTCGAHVYATYSKNGTKSPISHTHFLLHEPPAIPLELAKMWFREKHKIWIILEHGFFADWSFQIRDFLPQDPDNYPPISSSRIIWNDNKFYQTYEKTLEEGLLQACKLIKK